MRTDRVLQPTAEHLRVFRSCFSGLVNVYGTYDLRTGRARQVKRPVTDDVLRQHLAGQQPYGVYLLVDDRTRAVVADFDESDPWPPLEFVRHAAHYGVHAYLERSKRKGWHAWVFAQMSGVPAFKARRVVRLILDEIDKSATEVFPKHDRLDRHISWGNYIYAPLFGRSVLEQRTVFVDPGHSLQPYPHQWALLSGVKRVSEAALDEIIELNDLLRAGGPRQSRRKPIPPQSTRPTYGLPPCAQRMLAEGVIDCQRVACFRLALHFKKAGIPQDIAVAALLAWARKNRPGHGRRIITDAEIIAQTACAYAKPYRGCGCEEAAVIPYCAPNCPVRSRGRLAVTHHPRQTAVTEAEIHNSVG